MGTQWVAELTLLHDNMFGLQIVAFSAGRYSTVGSIIIINECLVLTRQQITSLAFVCSIAVLWEVQHRIVLDGMSTSIPLQIRSFDAFFAESHASAESDAAQPVDQPSVRF